MILLKWFFNRISFPPNLGRYYSSTMKNKSQQVAGNMIQANKSIRDKKKKANKVAFMDFY